MYFISYAKALIALSMEENKVLDVEQNEDDDGEGDNETKEENKENNLNANLENDEFENENGESLSSKINGESTLPSTSNNEATEEEVFI